MKPELFPSGVLGCFTGGQMNDAHCAVCRVHTLSSSTSRSERVDAKILWIDVDVKLMMYRGNKNSEIHS